MSKIHQSKEKHHNWMMFGTIGTLIAVAGIIAITALTIGYRPWLIWIVGPIFLIGLAFLAAMVVCRARISTQQEEGV